MLLYRFFNVSSRSRPFSLELEAAELLFGHHSSAIEESCWGGGVPFCAWPSNLYLSRCERDLTPSGTECWKMTKKTVTTA